MAGCNSEDPFETWIRILTTLGSGRLELSLHWAQSWGKSDSERDGPKAPSHHPRKSLEVTVVAWDVDVHVELVDPDDC